MTVIVRENSILYIKTDSPLNQGNKKMVFVGRPPLSRRRKGGCPTRFDYQLEMAKISWAPVLECLSLLDSKKYKSIEDVV